MLLFLLALTACDRDDRVVPHAAAPPEEVNYTSLDSPSLQFLPRGQEAPKWQLQEDPLVVPAKQLASYLDRDGARLARYEALEVTSGKYQSLDAKEGFAIVEIFRFPDFVKAFGAWSTSKTDTSKPLQIVNGAFENRHSLHLWRGPFYVRVTGGGTPDGDESLKRLLLSVADKMPAAPGMPAVFNFFPAANRIPNSERFSAESAFGQAFLANSFMASFTTPNNMKVDGLIIPAANKDAAAKILEACHALYVRNGKLLDPVPNLGEDNFTAEDRYMGRTVAFRIDRFVIVFNGFDDRQPIVDIASATEQRILGSIRKQLVTADERADNSDQPAQAGTPAWAQKRR
jgi:hypothetical protein